MQELGRQTTQTQRAIEDWEAIKNSRPLRDFQPLEVETNYAPLGWFFFVLCAVAAVWSFGARTGGPVIASCFGLFSLLGLYLVLAQTTFSADESSLRARSFFGKSRLEWDEVRKVEIGNGGQSLYFDAGAKRLVLGGPSWWRRRSREEMFAFLQAECARRNIEWKSTPGSPWFGSKNMRENSL